MTMKPILSSEVQSYLDQFVSKTSFIHLETTHGAYVNRPIGAFIRNAEVLINQAKITGEGPYYRVGLKIPMGWIYAEGLSVCDYDSEGRLLLEGHDENGKLQVALHLSLNSL